MALGQVYDLVSKHRGDLALALGLQYQCRMHADETAGHGERIDASGIHHEKREVTVITGEFAQAHAELLDIVLDFFVSYDRRVSPHLAHEPFTQLLFLFGRNDRSGGIAKVRQVFEFGRRRGSAGNEKIDETDKDRGPKASTRVLV